MTMPADVRKTLIGTVRYVLKRQEEWLDGLKKIRDEYANKRTQTMTVGGFGVTFDEPKDQAYINKMVAEYDQKIAEYEPKVIRKREALKYLESLGE